MPPPSQQPMAGNPVLQKVETLLLLGLVAPALGGVLLRGPRGIGKSTLVRSVGGLLPDRRILLVPPGTPEEDLFGDLDWEAVLESGRRVFRPGLLSRAHGQVLFLDGVNRMDAGVLQRILDVSETGVLRIERDGVSRTESAPFHLIAAMDPEEGELARSHLDRFGLCVSMDNVDSLERKKQVLSTLVAPHESTLSGLEDVGASAGKGRFVEAQENLRRMALSEEALRTAVEEAENRKCAGHRGEAALMRAAMAWAAWSGEGRVLVRHVRDMAAFALDHRMGGDSEPSEPPASTSAGSPQVGASPPHSPPSGHSGGGATGPGEATSGGTGSSEEAGREQDSDAPGKENGLPRETRQDIQDGYFGPEPKAGIPSRPGKGFQGGRRHGDRLSLRHGRSPGRSGLARDCIDWDATLKRALLFQSSRPAGTLRLAVHPDDLRYKSPKGPVGRILLFLVDASGSMGARYRMAAVKGSIRSALRRAYLSRDRVAMMAFRQRECRLLLPPTRSSEFAESLLRYIATGGGTPLAQGLLSALEFGRKLKLREPATPLHVLLFTDGRANVSLTGKDPVREVKETSERAAREGLSFTVVDTETGFVRLGMAHDLASRLGAGYRRLEDLRGDDFTSASKGGFVI